jgi:hypothetical protein
MCGPARPVAAGGAGSAGHCAIAASAVAGLLYFRIAATGTAQEGEAAPWQLGHDSCNRISRC